MAIDLGDKRIGIALSDPTWMVASSHSVIKRSSRKSDFAKIEHIVLEQDVVRIIVGLPTLPSGEEGTRAAWARDYAADLANSTSIEVDVWDESLTTVDAEESLRNRGISRERYRDMLDAVAAAFILQSYLDYLHEESTATAHDET
jgi:putative Holliday junction resolvase